MNLHLAIGAFDGVHLGHRAVINSARISASADGGCIGVLTYEPHPSKVLRPESSVPLIFSRNQKNMRLSEAGAQFIHYEKFDLVHANIEAHNFLSWLKDTFPALKSLHVGSNFRYGRGRMGTGNTLHAHALDSDINVQLVERVSLENDTVSSSRIRNLLRKGELPLANKMLLHPYEAEGQIVRGHQIGRTIGFPTLNLEWDPELKPALGVYVVEVVFQGENLPAVANYGLRPTIESEQTVPILEVNILQGIAPKLGEFVRIRWLHRLRDEIKFKDLSTLKAQIEIDSAQARQKLGLH